MFNEQEIQMLLNALDMVIASNQRAQNTKTIKPQFKQLHIEEVNKATQLKAKLLDANNKRKPM